MLFRAVQGEVQVKSSMALVYLKKFNISVTDYNPDSLYRWERPPIMIRAHYDNYSLSIYNIHTKPDNGSLELKNLESLIDEENININNNNSENKNSNNDRNIMLSGDLNADCYYYNPYSKAEFRNWKWVIGDNADTTSQESNCAYDRIIMNNTISNEYIRSGIDTSNIDLTVSDHYIVWVLIRDHDYKKDKTFQQISIF